MAEYIERDKLMKAFAEAETDVMADYGPNYGSEWGFSLDAVKQVMEKIPVADVAPVVHGRWEWHGPCHDNKGTYWATCSVCKVRQRLGDWENYCSACGAKMDKEATDGD